MQVVSYYFSAFILLPYYFIAQIHLCSIFLYSFLPQFCQKLQKICQFFAIFSRCVSTSYEKVEKIIAEKS